MGVVLTHAAIITPYSSSRRSCFVNVREKGVLCDCLTQTVGALVCVCVCVCMFERAVKEGN